MGKRKTTNDSTNSGLPLPLFDPGADPYEIVLSESDNKFEDPVFYLVQDVGTWRPALYYLTPEKNPSTFDQATILFQGKEDTQAFLDVRADYPREDEKIVILGFFPKFSGPEFVNFLDAADELNMDYHFCITKKPPPESDHVVRWFNFLDNRFEPIKITDSDDMVKYVEEKSTPYYTIYNVHPRRFVNKFLHSRKHKVVLFIDLDRYDAEEFKKIYYEVAKTNRGKGTLFMLGGLEDIKPLSFYFGSTKSKEPRIVFNYRNPRKIYVKEGLKPNDIKTWVEEDDKDGYSQPLPFRSLKYIIGSFAFMEEVLHSGKNVFLVLYGSRQSNRLHKPVELLSLFRDLAIHFEKENESDKEVVVAIMNRQIVDLAIQDVAVQDDVEAHHCSLNDEFLKALKPALKSLDDWKNPTLCFKPAKGDLMLYEDAIEEKDIIWYINKNKTAEQPKRPTRYCVHYFMYH